MTEFSMNVSNWQVAREQLLKRLESGTSTQADKIFVDSLRQKYKIEVQLSDKAVLRLVRREHEKLAREEFSSLRKYGL